MLGLGATSPFRLEGVVGLNDPLNASTNALVPYNTDMLRNKVLPADPEAWPRRWNACWRAWSTIRRS